MMGPLAYLLELKGNQESLNDDGRLFLADPATLLTQATQTNKEHRRIETRTACISEDVARQWAQVTPASNRETVPASRSGTIYRAGISPRSVSTPSYGCTGALRTGRIGSWTWCSTGTSPGTGRMIARKITPGYGNWRGTWPAWNPQKAP